MSQRSWVRFPFEPEFFQVSSFQLLKLKHLHCDDLHIILSLSAVQIYDYFIYSYLSEFKELLPVTRSKQVKRPHYLVIW